ncbi:peptidase, M23 family [Legionella adelaidensis]|uniref:Peptidase, M23 family n=1 Tax=Legionella adelaidensis TaxID=45056 RepID=A0A0W0R673_9GAMM|nr:peptidoglycan DD-metalloendopeptidase family protein [Legionella adelaidensis]KTC66523.1 peptidase, M23 family [Legionella adelaidensis]
MNTKLSLCLFTLLTFHIGATYGESVVVSQTKNKLKDLDNKIASLKQNLNTAQDKKGVLNRELANTEKKMGDSILKLRSIKLGIMNKQKRITELQEQVAILTEHLKAEEELLAKNIRSRYKMGEYEPLKWILNQNNPQMVSRVLTFYQYIIRARQRNIQEVHNTRVSLNTNKETLHNEIVAEQALQEDLIFQQKKLEQDKLYNNALVHSLNQEIQNTKQTLEEYQHNKENLSRLLKSLMQQSIVQSQKPFTRMRHQLIRPIGGRPHFEKVNQGVRFFANEGDSVVAVHGGKVVFSDWLKGYGLLLIIDHGYGFMSLYAHNQSLFKQKGEAVIQGEQIATVGHTGGLKQNGLYFEIRQRGKAVPPLEWLS